MIRMKKRDGCPNEMRFTVTAVSQLNRKKRFNGIKISWGKDDLDERMNA